MREVGAPSAGATTTVPTDERRLRSTAREVESIFLQHMLKTMRQASPSRGALLSGTGQRVYQEMMDEHMGRAMAKGGGLGLADMLVRDVIRRQGGLKKTSSEAASMPMGRVAGSNPGQGGAK